MNTSHQCGIAHYYPEFAVLDDGRFRCLAMTLSDGRYVVITDMGGMAYPDIDDFMVCVYRNAEAFGDDPGVGLLGSFTSDDFADIDHALGAAEYCTEEAA
jgi:hypothetical protein